MTQSLATYPLHRPGESLVATLERSQTLGFPLRVLGQNDGPIFPQRVGNWWLEPLSKETELPPRAKQRLQALLSTGLKTKAVVVFHEIPDHQGGPSRFEKVTARGLRWAQQELPVLAERGAAKAKEYAPVAGRVLLSVGGIAITVLGLLAIGTMYAMAAALSDPCLVVVTEDGYWIEVDRWYD